MKKNVLILILIILLSTSTGCFSQVKYKFIHSESEIEKIEFGTIDEFKHLDGYRTRLIAEKEFIGEDIAKILEDFHQITCYKNITHPDNVGIGEYAIKITYFNGNFEMIDYYGQYKHKDGRDSPDGWYYFDEEEFAAFINKYLE